MTPSPPRLKLVGISKSYGDQAANKNISLTIMPGEVHGILGENGAGKSTLMKCIYGVEQPDSGQIFWNSEEVRLESPHVARGLGIGMVFQHFCLIDRLTTMQNLSLGTHLDSQTLTQRLSQLEQSFSLNVELDRYVETLSVGEKQRVELTAALLNAPSLLILDEPTSVLTPKEISQLTTLVRRLASSGCSILLITHKLEEAKAMCDTFTILRRGEVTAHRLAASVDTSQLAAAIVGESVDLDYSYQHHTPSDPILRVEELSTHPDHAIDTSLKNISFELNRGEILGVVGIAGNGQDTLSDIFNVLPQPVEGKLTLLKQDTAAETPASIQVLPADRTRGACVNELPLWENYALTQLPTYGNACGLLDKKRAKAACLAALESYDVRGANIDSKPNQLSGGNLQKFLLGRALASSPDILICNNPTWGIDIHAKHDLHDRLIRLRDNGLGILLISQDMDEILVLSDRVAVICDGHLSPVLSVSEATPTRLGLWMSDSTFHERLQ